MIRDRRDRQRRPEGAASRRRVMTAAPVLEPLEDRVVLSHFYAGPTAIRPVQTPGGMFTVSVSGPGLVNVQQLGKGVVGLKLYGTTSATTVDVVQSYQKLHKESSPLQIGSIKVLSGQVGTINASAATLLGTMTPLRGSVNALDFGGLGPNARVDVLGALGSLSLGAVDLGPNGHLTVGGDVSGALTVSGPLSIDGGTFRVGRDLSGGATLGGLTVADHGLFAVGRDAAGTVAVGGDLRLESGGTLSVGRDLNALTVGGNLVVAPPAGSASGPPAQMVVGGNLNSLQVNGQIIGQGSKDATDLKVGLDLGKLTVLGSGPDQGGIYQANIDVGKSILGLDVRHGIFDSFITAGVLIDGGTGGTAGNVGPDATDAVLNSEIRAGVNIRNLTFNGDVRSTFVNGPQTGYPTRIVAGEDRAGHFAIGGLIDNFQITGQLVDAVVAASVAPSGGSGVLPPAGYGPSYVGTPSDKGSYDAPAGTISGGTVGAPVKFANFGIVSYVNEERVNPPGTVGDFNTTLTPAPDDTILPGSINPSFASAPLPAQSNGTTTSNNSSSSSGNSSGSSTTTTIASLADPNSPLPLPVKPTVLGGVVSTPHAAGTADFAGVFASDLKGVFIGNLPS